MNHGLDTDLKQCLIDYFDDGDGMRWHHRLLLLEGTSGQWIASSPDYDVALLDLTAHRVVPMTRTTRLPPARVAESYLFDPLQPGDEAMLMDQARALAEMMGFKPIAGATAAGGTWRLSDTAHEAFGAAVPPEALGAAGADEMVIRGGAGLVKYEEEWTTMERVPDGELESWKAGKTTESGLDRRVLPWLTEASGKEKVVKARSQSEAYRLWKKGEKPAIFPFEGPPLLPEFFEGLEESGLTLVTHHQQWLRASGVSDTSSAARWHHAMCEQLRLLGFVDQLDLSQLVTAEYICREIMKVEMAVERNPKVPDWSGLEMLTTTRLSESGGVSARRFMKWVSTAQKDQAFVLKQGREVTEEKRALAKAKAGKKGGKTEQDG